MSIKFMVLLLLIMKWGQVVGSYSSVCQIHGVAVVDYEVGAGGG